ncbi:hypothetical protein Ddye_027838 [Dipteronia dyeriana]|uniref:Uncharacterized protein n=1 Tax=Dipteronia dyeriana TaxID=168575 RepID=A0AAD9TQP7_9ROSI|nr:hypothetical protein Ddye_027838 [Dipteronia dyeriana]
MTGSLSTRGAILSNKKYLKELMLDWDSQFDDSRNEIAEKDAIEMLRPHKNLKELTVKGYGGRGFPSWLGDPSFSKMVFLRLESCKKCIALPMLGQLGSLKNLTIKEMAGLKSIGLEIYGGSSKPFKSLETLCIEDLQEWECWDPTEENEQIKRFPHLHKLSIVKCPKLSGKLPNHLPSLEKLVILDCVQLVVSLKSLPLLCKLEIDGCKEVECISSTVSKSLISIKLSNVSEAGNWLRQEFHKVDRLKIIRCEKLINLWQCEVCLGKPPQGLHSFTFLRELSIKNCNALTSLPDGMRSHNAHLESLRIDGCDSLTFVLRGQLPSSLKNLEIWYCKKLQCLLEDSEDSSSSSSSVIHMENITDTSTCLLEYLYVDECPSISQELGKRPFTCST